MAAVPRNKTVSSEWREKGNKSYGEAGRALSPHLQVSRLQEALNCYSHALNTASDDLDRSSAYKNLAMAYWKMARAQSFCCWSSAVISFYFKEALSHFQDARDCGRGRGVSWLEGLVESSVACWDDVRTRIDEWDTELRVRELNQLVRYIIDDLTKAREHLELANHYFHWSVTALGERDYQQCLSLLRECHYPLKEAEKFGRHNHIINRECALLEEDIFIQQCVAQSIQERMKGEALLSHIIRDEEILNIDMVWEVVDTFRSAARLTRDRDLEMEAMALSALGKVYHQILKMKDRAKSCLMKSVELANTMVPRNFSGNDWYEFARSTLENYQQEQVRSVEEEHQKQREETLKLIKEELDALKKKKTESSKVEFLKFVYTTHPPKNDKHKMGEVSANPEWTELKKLYQKAVIHYHPDKVNVAEHGAKWKVLSEEITKLLTQHYEFFKGCEPDPYEDSE